MKKIKINKNVAGVIILVLLIGLTLWTVFKDNDIGAVFNAMLSLKPEWFIVSAVTAIFFVCAEGLMIWYLLRTINCKSSLLSCFGYSFVGFFFSGITPSSSGGQPMQLYYMTKDKIKISDSTVALTVVAVLYKAIIVLVGVFIAIFCNSMINEYLGGYIYLFYFGLLLNVIVVIVLLLLMISPNAFRKIMHKCERLLVKMHILKPSLNRIRKLTNIAYDYNHAITRFIKNFKAIAVTAFITLLQRCSLFFITYFIYKGMGLNDKDVFLITVLQASIYVAVDLLPLPGSQGISELMYQTVFGTIFTGTLLPASVLITRGISFYLPLIIGVIVTIFFHITRTKRAKKSEQA